MRRLGLALACVLWAVPAAAQEPIARARLLDRDPVLVSSGARLAVEVLVPTFFRGPVQFPEEIELPDAIVRLAPGSSTNLNERIDGASWAGIRRTYRVYPIRPGTIRIEALPVTIVYALDNGRGSDPTTVRTGPVQFEAYLPEEARGLVQFFASEEFTLDGAIEPANNVRVGEAVKRSFTMTARNTPGLFLPRLEFAELDGARVYPGQAALEETGGQRGTARTAQRTESVTYTFVEEGTFELPAITVNWWDLSNNRLVTESVPATTITVEPNPELDAAMTEVAPPEDAAPEPVGRPWVDWLRDHWQATLAAIVALYLAVRVGLPTLHRVGVWLEARRADRAASEGRHFRDFVSTARRGTAVETYRALTRWLDSWAPPGQTMSAESFGHLRGDESLRREIDALTDAAFGDANRKWSPQALVRGVENARRRDHAAGRAPAALPPLNPPNTART